jgi:hypothetical protein
MAAHEEIAKMAMFNLFRPTEITNGKAMPLSS